MGVTADWKAALFIVLLAFCALSYRQQSVTLNKLVGSIGQSYDGHSSPPNVAKMSTAAATQNQQKQRPRIAIMSSFVPNAGVTPPPRLKDEYIPHIMNKACYSYIWGYDFIFNTTYGFDGSYPKWHWLDFGTWHRVPHVASRIRDYDWILYTDTDFLIQDLMRPLEAFVNEFELYGKTNVQLFVPVDHDRRTGFTFSAFAFMIRNSPYGRDLLRHWDDFARGVCPKGNTNATASREYGWLDTDQPGLWYAMMRTYADYFPDRVPKNNYPQCNKTTGILNTHSPPWNNFFKNMKDLTKGSTGKELSEVPDDQPYIFTSFPDGLRSGLALQLNWGTLPKRAGSSFALHLKNITNSNIDKGVAERLAAELEHCKEKYGCYAGYDERGELKIGCRDKIYL